MKPLLFSVILAVSAAAAFAQVATTNDDVIKLSKSGLSEQFILDLIEKQPARFSTDVSRLLDLKENKVSETVILAVARKTPPTEPLTSDGLQRLGKGGFSQSFLLELLDKYPSRISTDAVRLAELKQDGVSESVLAAAVRKSPPPDAINVDGVLALTKAGFSESFILDLVKRRQTNALDTSRIIELKNAGVSERVIAAMVDSGASRTATSGTEIVVRTIDPIDSDKNSVGDTFRATLEEPISVNGEVVAEKGADVRIKLVDERESGKFRGRAELTIAAVALMVKGQEIRLITTSVQEASGSRGARTAKSAAAVGAVGAIIGAIAGGGKGAAIGAGAGAATGAGAQAVMKGQKVKVASETVLTFTLKEPVRIR